MTTDMTRRYEEQADIFFILKCHRNIGSSADKVKADGVFLMIPPSLFFQIWLEKHPLHLSLHESKMCTAAAELRTGAGTVLLGELIY